MTVQNNPGNSSLAAQLQKLLSDELMAFLALITLALAAVPFAFEVTPELEQLLMLAELVIVALFTLEYATAYLLAVNRRAFLLNPWRLLDVFIILTALVSLLPFTTETLGASPALRLIRFVRVAVLGTRSSSRLANQSDEGMLKAPQQEVAINAYALDLDGGARQFDTVDWQRVLERIGSDQDDWLFVTGVSERQLSALAAQLKVPEPVLRSKLFGAAFPRLDRLERYVTLFAWYPHLSGEVGADSTVINRTGLLLVGAAQNVAVLVREPGDLLDRVGRRLTEEEPGASALVSATHALVKEIVRSYARVAEHLEARLMRIEAVEPSLRDREFLQRTFLLRAEISRVRTTLRHLSVVTRSLNSRRIAIRGFETGELPQFQMLASEVADLYERVDDLSQNLSALVDMRLNVSSFQMNKVMRLLAILTTLALIPSVAGGMLGMNLIDTPWPASLPQVAFWVGSSMAFSLYLFAIKGWLR